MAPVKSVCLKSYIKKTEKVRADQFEVKESDEVFEVKDGQVLVKMLYLSVDPVLRFKLISEPSFMSPWPIGEPCIGVGVGVVLQSKFPGISEQDIVESIDLPYKTQFVIDGGVLNKYEQDTIKSKPSLALGCCGLTGLTAYFGIRERCHIEPGKNQTVVVSGAAGGVGSVAGQIAKIKGAARVIGICGSEVKCKFLTEELGFTAAINYKTDDIPAVLKSLCPNGIDCYFDNVGGEISDHVARHMSKDSFIALCGQIATYDKDTPFMAPVKDEIAAILKEKNCHREFFAVSNYKGQYKEAVAELAKWYEEGKLKAKETVLDGIENVGNAFLSVLTGGNIGKQLVKVA